MCAVTEHSLGSNSESSGVLSYALGEWHLAFTSPQTTLIDSRGQYPPACSFHLMARDACFYACNTLIAKSWGYCTRVALKRATMF